MLAGSEEAGTQFDEIAESFPRGALAILRRYHNGGTSSPSEHWADIYADYFFTVVGSETYNVNRGEPTWRCARNCRRTDQQLARRVAEAGEELPLRDREAMTELRYEALFRCSAFEGIERQQASTTVHPTEGDEDE